MEKKNLLRKAIYVAFFIIVMLLFYITTFIIQKYYLQNPINLVCAMVLLNTMIGFAEGTCIVKCLKKKTVSKFPIAIFGISLIFWALGFAMFPINTNFIFLGIIIAFASVFVVMIYQIVLIVRLLKNRQLLPVFSCFFYSFVI